MGERRGIVAFDMDGTLLDGRFVIALADACDAREHVIGIMNGKMHGYEKSRAIARLWKGLRRDDLLEALARVPLSTNAREAVEALKGYGYVVGIISDSYDTVVEHLASILGMDFSVANRLVYDSSGALTGRIVMPLGWERINCRCMNSVCKRFHLESMMRRLGISRSAAVGDNDNDICMLERADVSVAYRPKSTTVREKAMYIIDDLYDTVRILA
ncbi:MAG: HAD-IB family phosphatase [Candidatus Nitrosocaldus sp.]|nr:HAD family phosphatase [Candidatus Nitrosocaldus sp.]MDW8275912.1 HAD-IB family phosphatase [Candidatus Nitrosocaldus sp.]